MKQRTIVAIVIVCFLLVSTGFAAIISIDAASATIVIKPVDPTGKIVSSATIDSTGKVISEPKDEKGKPIDTKGFPVDDKGISTTDATSVYLEVSNEKQVERKTVQLYPDAKVAISSDFTTIMQTTEKGSPALEIYYGYQKSDSEPWTYYMRVDSISSDTAIIVKADFVKRTVWTERVKPKEIMDIIKSGKIPAWEDLPLGEIIALTETKE